MRGMLFLTLLGWCFCISDTPGITRLLQLLGGVGGVGGLREEWCSSNPPSGTAGVSSFHLSVLIHMHTD